MDKERKPQTADKYIVRFPDGMRERINEAAKENGRSMNSEIIDRLEKSFSEENLLFPPQQWLFEKLMKMEEQNEELRAALKDLAQRVIKLGENNKD